MKAVHQAAEALRSGWPARRAAGSAHVFVGCCQDGHDLSCRCSALAGLVAYYRITPRVA